MSKSLLILPPRRNLDDDFDFEVDAGDDGTIHFYIDGWRTGLSPDEAVDLATKIINHCYPFTTGRTKIKSAGES
jgi:hypothetical protein